MASQRKRNKSKKKTGERPLRVLPAQPTPTKKPRYTQYQGGQAAWQPRAGRPQLNPWPTDEWNPFIGCTPKSRGCHLCYAARRYREEDPENLVTEVTESGRAVYNGQVVFFQETAFEPLRIRDPRIIFFCANSDPFSPGMDKKPLDLCFDVMEMSHWHQYNLLTKYPEYGKLYMKKRGYRQDNLRFGISAENQQTLDERYEHLKEIKAAWHIISLQPLLEEIRLPDFKKAKTWVVAMREVGGKGAAPCKPEWIESLRRQCRDRNVPFYWEVTEEDGKELVEHRVAVAKGGDPYMVNKHTWGDAREGPFDSDQHLTPPKGGQGGQR